MTLDYETLLEAKDLSCHSIAADAFLLLSRVREHAPESIDQAPSHRRVGCALGCDEPHFFDNAKMETVTII